MVATDKNKVIIEYAEQKNFKSFKSENFES